MTDEYEDSEEFENEEDFEFEFDYLEDFDELDDVMVIAVTADPETWLPQILVGVPIDPVMPFQADTIAPITLTPEEAYQIGAYLIQAASTVSSFYSELVDKSIEERKEIISLESHFLGSPFPL